MGCCESIPSRSIDPPAQYDQLQHSKDDDGGAIIYVENLPRNISATRIEKEFKKFGKIKSEKIRVRSEGSNACAFIQFETRASAAKAIQASPLVMCGRRVFIEEKRSSSCKSTGRHHNYHNYNQNQKGHCQGNTRTKRQAHQYEDCNTPCNSPNAEECNTTCNSPDESEQSDEFSFPLLLPE